MFPFMANEGLRDNLGSRIKTRCTLVLQLIDSVTGSEPMHQDLKVWLEDIPRRPYLKQDGFAVFTDLEEGDYVACISSGIYAPVRMQVSTRELDVRNPVIPVSLLPLPQYPFRMGATLLRGFVEGSSGRPCPGASIQVCVQFPEAALAALAQPVAAGETRIQIADLSGKISPGDEVRLFDSKQDMVESCRILTLVDDGPRIYQLTSPMGHAFQRGALIAPIFYTQTDHRGEWAVNLRGRFHTNPQIKLTVYCGKSKFSGNVAGEAGKTTFVHLSSG